MHQIRSLVGQALRFGAVGLINTFVGLGSIFALMALLGVPPLLANVLGYALGICTSYVLNRRWTFRTSHSSWEMRLRFVAVMGGAYLIQLALLAFALSAGIDPYVAQVVAMVVYAALGFLGSRVFVFATHTS